MGENVNRELEAESHRPRGDSEFTRNMGSPLAPKLWATHWEEKTPGRKDGSRESGWETPGIIQRGDCNRPGQWRRRVKRLPGDTVWRHR